MFERIDVDVLRLAIGFADGLRTTTDFGTGFAAGAQAVASILVIA